MKLIGNNPAVIWGIAFFLGLAVGYMMFDNSAELRRISYQLAQAEVGLAAFRPKQRTLLGVAGSNVNNNRLDQTSKSSDFYSNPITMEDIAQSRAMNERQRNGEYILKFERPVDRKLMQAGIMQMASKLASNSCPQLRAVVLDLGLSQEASYRLEQHERKIALASLEAEMAMQQLGLAQEAYDKQVRSALTPDLYKRYRHYEDSKAAFSEYHRIEDFAKTGGTPIDPAYQMQIVACIEGAQAYTQVLRYGPYDTSPQVAIGPNNIIALVEQQIGQLRDASTKLRRALVETNLPKLSLDVIEGYYSADIKGKQAIIERIKSSDPAITR